MPGTPTQACYLRRRRREVALFCIYISRKGVPLLDAKPTLTLRPPNNILTDGVKMGGLSYFLGLHPEEHEKCQKARSKGNVWQRITA
jgi:hypothetical protein